MAEIFRQGKPSGSYEDGPFIVPPASGQHRQSFVLLHGRGSNGHTFGLQLLQTPVPRYRNSTIKDLFPHAKFIFPTAPRRRAQLYNRALTHQWFDNWCLTTPTEREELQFEGLQQSTHEIHELLRTEIQAVGGTSVILWGLSQGCAAALIATLLSSVEKRVAAVIGMCGWLPLREQMELAAGSEQNDEFGDDLDNPFATSNDGGDQECSRAERVVTYLREEMGVGAGNTPSEPFPAIAIPIFLAHGTEDDRVPVSLGREAATFLQLLEIVAIFQTYDGLGHGHWHSRAMLDDIVAFVAQRAGWEIMITAH